MGKTQIGKEQANRFLELYFKKTIQHLEVVNSGEFSQAYSFEESGQQFVIRFNANTDEGFKKEAIIRQEYGDIPTPKIIDRGTYEGFHYSLTEAYQGLQLHKLDDAAIHTILPSLFETMNTIHRQEVKADGFGLWAVDKRGQFNSFEAQLRRFMHADKWEAWAGQHPFFDISFAQKLKAEFDSLVQYIPQERYFLHGDFSRTNIFALGDKIEGVIDWSEAMYGDFLLDVAWCAFWESRVDMIDAYRKFNWANNQLDINHFEERVRLYLIFSSLNNLVFEVARGRAAFYFDTVAAVKRNLNI